MSINGGFATRQLDETYNTLVYNLIYLLQYRIKRLYNSEVVSEKNFQKVLAKTFKKVQQLEGHKYTPPRFSEAMKDLADLLLNDLEFSTSRSPKTRTSRRSSSPVDFPQNSKQPVPPSTKSGLSYRDNSTEVYLTAEMNTKSKAELPKTLEDTSVQGSLQQSRKKVKSQNNTSRPSRIQNTAIINYCQNTLNSVGTSLGNVRN